MVYDDGRVIAYIAPLAFHGNRTGGGQQGETGALDKGDGNLSIVVLHRYQIGVDALVDVTDKAVVAEMSEVEEKGLPFFQQGDMERVALKTVDNIAV